MLDVSELRHIFNEKLAATDSLDAAFTKAVWVAFKAGAAHGAEAERLLEALVAALDDTHISSWQSTAGWTDQLAAARQHVAKGAEMKATPDGRMRVGSYIFRKPEEAGDE